MAYYNQKILVTGASGLLGRELCRQLLAKGHHVVAVDNGSRFSGYRCEHSSEYHDCDLVEFLASPQQFDLIFHFAAVNGTKHFYQTPTNTLTNNARVDLAMYEFAMTNCCGKLVYASSSEVVSGTSTWPTPEQIDISIANIHNRRWSYMLPKIMMENLLANGPVPYLILRYFNVVSEHSGTGHFIRDIVDNIRSGNHDLVGGDETRSFCYVEDAISASIELSQLCHNDFINVGNDEEITILTAATLVANKLGAQVKWNVMPGLAGSAPRRVPDLSKLRRYIPDYRPRDFASALDRVLQPLFTAQCL